MSKCISVTLLWHQCVFYELLDFWVFTLCRIKIELKKIECSFVKIYTHLYNVIYHNYILTWITIFWVLILCSQYQIYLVWNKGIWRNKMYLFIYFLSFISNSFLFFFSCVFGDFSISFPYCFSNFKLFYMPFLCPLSYLL